MSLRVFNSCLCIFSNMLLINFLLLASFACFLHELLAHLVLLNFQAHKHAVHTVGTHHNVQGDRLV